MAISHCTINFHVLILFLGTILFFPLFHPADSLILSITLLCLQPCSKELLEVSVIKSLMLVVEGTGVTQLLKRSQIFRAEGGNQVEI